MGVQGQAENALSSTGAEGRTGDPSFRTTHWSAVLAARGEDSTAAYAALCELCQTYWYPLYAFIRRRGNPPDEAADLTQAFFTRVIEKNYLSDLTPGMGRFRSFLLASAKHFLANEWDKAQTLKRGGGKTFIPLDDDAAETRFRFEPADPVTPEVVFERRWACTVLDQVLGRLRQEFEAFGVTSPYSTICAKSVYEPFQLTILRESSSKTAHRRAHRVVVHREGSSAAHFPARSPDIAHQPSRFSAVEP